MLHKQDPQSKGGDYKVGYKKPPKRTQYPPGRSGNPKGRPRKDRLTKISTDELILTELGGRCRESIDPKKFTNLELIIIRLVRDAVSGKRHAQNLIIGLLQRTSNSVAGSEVDYSRDVLAKLKAMVAFNTEREEI
ncbi:DUF5681 domain-containing protein [Microvirga pudoricolor]|uniref:DUF5681 domain-containing protein n=1 Tax=Microvirga pudoricolor TaxID=2778729 RepID=UPI003898F80A